MNIFPEMYNLPRLNQEQTENLNRLITSEVIESVRNKTFQQTKVQDQMVSLVNSTKYLNRNEYQPFSNFSKKKRREHFRIQFIGPALPLYITIEGYAKKRKLQANIPDEHR